MGDEGLKQALMTRARAFSIGGLAAHVASLLMRAKVEPHELQAVLDNVRHFYWRERR